MPVTPEGRNLVFLLGMPRSGTTLLSILLDRHPRLTAPPEPWLMLALEALGNVSPRHAAASPLLGEAVRQFQDDIDSDAALASFAADLYSRKLTTSGAEIMVDKTPRYHLIIDRLLTLFPEARVLLLLRNPFAVLSSFKTTWHFDIVKDHQHGHRPFLYYDLALGLRRLAELHERQDPRVLTVRYEDLVGSPDTEMGRIQDFLGLEGLTASGDGTLGQAGAAFRTSMLGDQKVLATSNVHTSSLDAWQDALTPEEMQAGSALWGRDLLTRLGYAPALEQAERHGVRCPSEEVVTLRVEDIRAEEDLRRRDCLRTSRITPDVDDLLLAIDTAYAAPQDARHLSALVADLREAHRNAENGWQSAREGWQRAENERQALETALHDAQSRITHLQHQVADLSRFVDGLRHSRVISRYLHMRGGAFPEIHETPPPQPAKDPAANGDPS